jgi:hypothetical protein
MSIRKVHFPTEQTIGYTKHVTVLSKAVYIRSIYVRQVHLHEVFYSWFIFLALFPLSSLLSSFLQLLFWSLLYVLYPPLTLLCFQPSSLPVSAPTKINHFSLESVRTRKEEKVQIRNYLIL